LSTIAIPKSIIVVDDEHDLVDLFSDALSSNGYDVSSFTDPTIAFENIKKNLDKYSLLITDFRMNDMNGCELGIKVKELNSDIQVIIISAYENVENTTANFEVLSKPITIQILIKKVNDYLNR
jgi:DNA-binding NtrC family response regulator